MRSRPLLHAVLLFQAVRATAGDSPPIPVVLALEDQANEIWSALPDAANDERVVRLGHTSPACADDALRRAKNAIARGQAGRIALRTLSLEVPLPRPVLKAASAPSTGQVADLFGHYVRSSSEQDFVARARGARATEQDSYTDAALGALYRALLGARSDHALQPLLDPSCPGVALYEIRALPDRPGRLYLNMLVEGGCACAGAKTGQPPRQFRVLGQAELEPGTGGFDAKGVTLRWRAGPPRYTVLASCAACGERDSDDRPAEATPGACGEPCAPLRRATAGWGREVSAAEAQMTAVAAEVTGHKSEVAQHRKELRAALDEARERIGALRRAADEARTEGARCEAQCRARRQTADPAGAKAARSGGGGGAGTTALVLGGSAAAAVATAVALTPSEPAPSLEGTWAGTSVTEILFQGVQCVRAHNETWEVRRVGASFTVDITRTETCGGTFTCDGCLSRAFPPRTVAAGVAEGNRFTFPSWFDVFFGPQPCPVTGSFDGQRLSAASTGPCTVLVVPEGPVLHQYRISLSRR